jgi:SanA protein
LKRKVLYGVVIATVLAVAVATCCDFMVSGAACGRTYDSIAAVPHRTTALLLGTGPVSRWGGPNRYYYTRIDAAAELYKAGKIDSIIVSGARRGDYDEPSMMIADLSARGPNPSLAFQKTIGILENLENLETLVILENQEIL